MECKKIQELLLTDYIDGEAGDALKDEVERHVNICHTCREFQRDLIKTIIDPFRKARERKLRERKLPDLVWNHIKEAIVLEERKKSEGRKKSRGFLADLRSYLSQPFSMPSIYMPSMSKPALALATITGAVLVLMITVTRFQMNNREIYKVYPDKEVEYLAKVIGGSEYFSPDENKGYGTAIEEYFF